MLFPDRTFAADMTAKMLLEVKAVHFSQDKPFIFTSGWASPVYIDCRKLIFYPRIRGQLVEFAAATLARDAGFTGKRVWTDRKGLFVVHGLIAG